MTGNAALDKIIIGINLLGALLGIGMFVFTEMIYQRPLLDAEILYQEFLTEVNNENNLETYQLPKMTTNLISQTKRLRYLDFQAQLEPLRSKYLDEFNADREVILDIFIAISSKMKPADLNTLTGKILLESRLKEAINGIYKKPVIKRIYFTKFIVQ